jgi:hypothetical protein
MTEPSGRTPANEQPPGQRGPNSWEQRAAGVASDVQRWLIKTSARNMRDELGGQVKKAFRGSERSTGDSWATATTEPPHAADEAPECAWCPVCRAARRIAQARAGADASQGGGRGSGYGGPKLGDAADVMAGAVRDALAGLDAVLSYRPGGTAPSASSAGPGEQAPAARRTEPPAGPASPAVAPASAWEAATSQPEPARAQEPAAEPSDVTPPVAGQADDPAERA